MAVVAFGGNRYTGLSTDSKPGAPDGSFFYETDTGSEFVRISGEWVQRNFGSSSVITAADTSVIMTAWDSLTAPKLLTDLKIDNFVEDSSIDLVNSICQYDPATKLVSGPASGAITWADESISGTTWDQLVRGISGVTYRDAAYLFGGNTGDGGTDFQLTHKYNILTGLWQTSLACTGTLPPVRWAHCAAVYDKFMYLFGGTYGAGNNRQDTHRLNLETLEWSNTLPVTGTKPSARYGAGCFVYNGYLWVFGGAWTVLNDLHRLDLTTLNWSGALSTSGTPPSARCFMSFVQHGGYGYVFGGGTASATLQDVHRINLSTLAWSDTLSCSGTPPSIRQGHNTWLLGDYLYVGNGAGTIAWGTQRTGTGRLHIPTLTWEGDLANGTVPAGYGRAHWSYGKNAYCSYGIGTSLGGYGYVKKLSVATANLILITDSWEASANNPTSAYVVFKILPGEAYTLMTDVNAYVSMNDGTNYEEFTNLEVYQTEGSYHYIRGTITGLTAQDDKTMRLKITTSNSKDIRVAAQALGVGY